MIFVILGLSKAPFGEDVVFDFARFFLANPRKGRSNIHQSRASMSRKIGTSRIEIPFMKKKLS